MLKINKLIYFILFISIYFSAISVRAFLPEELDGQALPSLAPMLEKVMPAVINISTEGRIKMQQHPFFADPFFRHFFDLPNQMLERKTQSLGSGVIVDAKKGLVLTNSHVIANAVQITVTLRDGRRLEAKLVGSDPETDIAVIKIPAKDLTDIKIADSDQLRIGDFVVAIGNPFGLGQTVTSGIVSALSRSGLGIEGYEDFIQTDASINPGNSGGALVNLRGELVGINTAILSQGGGSIGIGFAIPVNLALQITEQLSKNGEVKRSFLGVHVQDLTAELAEAFDLPYQQGAIIVEVKADSPADKAGLMTGDIITAIDGKSISSAAAVKNRVALLPVGARVNFEILRSGKRKKVIVVTAEGNYAASKPNVSSKLLAGVIVGDIKEGDTRYAKMSGVVVFDLERGSPAWRGGLRKGDLITSVNRIRVRDMQDFLRAVNGQHDSLLLRIVRGNAAAFLVLK